MEEQTEQGSCPCCRSDKRTVRSQEEKHKLLNRLHRIEGQLRGIEAMLLEDVYCNDILIQSAAVNAAMGAFERALLESHLHSCVARDIRAGRDEVMDELAETLRRLMR